MSRRTSDQDLHAKLAKAHDRGNAETKSRGGGRPTSGEFGGKLQRGRRGTVVPDSQAALDGKYAKKKMVGSRF